MSDKYAALRASKPYELRFSRLWERYDEACHGNAEHMRDILELALDALETAERRIANSDRDALVLLAERDADKARIAELEKGHAEAAKQITSWRRIAKKNIAEREADIAVLTEARQRIAELEARTLTVTLPHYRATYKEAFASEVEHHVRTELEKLAAAAGISLKIEGE